MYQAITESGFKEERKQALMTALQEIKDLIFHCQCNETSDQDFILRLKYDTPQKEIPVIASFECLKKSPTETRRKIVCTPYQETDEQKQDETIEHLGGWLGLALTKKALGDEELALACLKRSLDIDPQNPRALELKKQWLFSDFFQKTPSFLFMVFRLFVAFS